MARTRFTALPAALLASDWHLREDTPKCRTDDFFQTMWRKIRFVKELQEKYDCPVFHAGDLGEYWRWSDYLLSLAIDRLPKKFFTIAGQHDLPNHNLELMEKCGLHTLGTGKHITILDSGHFGTKPKPFEFAGRQVMLWHRLVWHGKRPWPGCTDPSADEVLNRFPNCDLILTGDNHEAFTCEDGDRVLVNPGSLMRQKADQVDHRPRVYLWYAETNQVTPVFIPIEADVITREHIEEERARDDRITSFISRLNTDCTIGTTFEENLEQFERENTIAKSVSSIIHKAMEKEM